MATKRDEPRVEVEGVPSDAELSTEGGVKMVRVEVVRDSGYFRDGVHYLRGQTLEMPAYAVKYAAGEEEDAPKPPFVKRVKD